MAPILAPDVLRKKYFPILAPDVLGKNYFSEQKDYPIQNDFKFQLNFQFIGVQQMCWKFGAKYGGI
jgi:hypothetical protein